MRISARMHICIGGWGWGRERGNGARRLSSISCLECWEHLSSTLQSSSCPADVAAHLALHHSVMGMHQGHLDARSPRALGPHLLRPAGDVFAYTAA